jgi:hypothetical protein
MRRGWRGAANHERRTGVSPRAEALWRGQPNEGRLRRVEEQCNAPDRSVAIVWALHVENALDALLQREGVRVPDSLEKKISRAYEAKLFSERTRDDLTIVRAL